MSLLVLSFALITTPDGSRRAVRVCRVTRVLPDAMNKGLWIKSIPRLLMLVRAHRFGTMIKRTKAQRVLADKAYASTANPAATLKRLSIVMAFCTKRCAHRPLCVHRKSALASGSQSTALPSRTVLWYHCSGCLDYVSSAILRGRQNPRADGHGRPLADLAQGRTQDHFQQINPGNRRAQTENTNPHVEIAADWKTPLLKS